MKGHVEKGAWAALPVSTAGRAGLGRGRVPFGVTLRDSLTLPLANLPTQST